MRLPRSRAADRGESRWPAAAAERLSSNTGQSSKWPMPMRRARRTKAAAWAQAQQKHPSRAAAPQSRSPLQLAGGILRSQARRAASRARLPGSQQRRETCRWGQRVEYDGQQRDQERATHPEPPKSGAARKPRAHNARREQRHERRSDAHRQRVRDPRGRVGWRQLAEKTQQHDGPRAEDGAENEVQERARGAP